MAELKYLLEQYHIKFLARASNKCVTFLDVKT